MLGKNSFHFFLKLLCCLVFSMGVNPRLLCEFNSFIFKTKLFFLSLQAFFQPHCLGPCSQSECQDFNRVLVWEKSLERLTVKRRASSASFQEETAKLPFHQLAFYCRASQQVCLSLHVLLTSCTVSTMVSRLFSAVVMHFTHSVCFGRHFAFRSSHNFLLSLCFS